MVLFVLVCSLNAEGDDFISTWDEVHETFDVMGLHENLLRGIYAYGTGLSIKLNGTFLIFGNMCTSDSHYLVKLLDNFISFSCMWCVCVKLFLLWQQDLQLCCLPYFQRHLHLDAEMLSYKIPTMLCVLSSQEVLYLISHLFFVILVSFVFSNLFKQVLRSPQRSSNVALCHLQWVWM
jgi:hypothetical protein